MGVQYQAVGWKRQKRTYDAILISALGGYLAIFAGIGELVHPNATAETSAGPLAAALPNADFAHRSPRSTAT